MLNHCQRYIIIRCLIIVLSVVFGINNTNAADRDNIENIQAELAWAESDGENYEIYFSSLSNNLWTKKLQLTNNNFTNILPSISSGSDGVISIVWSAISDSRSNLFFCKYFGNSWSDPVQISTNFSSNTSPCIIVDNENIPWIVWAGFDGEDDDIFFTRWDGNDWGIPSRINRDDSYPDILPVIGIDEGGIIWVSWAGYDGDKYRNYMSKWTETGWEDETIAEGKTVSQLMIMKEADNIPKLPDFLHDLDVASIHIKGESPKSTIRLRDLSNVSNVNKLSYEQKTEINSNQVSDQVIIGFGDSITQGVPYVIGYGDGRRVGGYEPELELLLDADSRPYQVLNYGIGGETTPWGVGRIGYNTLGKHNAKYILILEGTNDIILGISPESTIYNLGVMIDKSRGYNAIPVLSTLTPDTKAGNPEKNIPTVYNPKIVDLSAEKGVTLCDQYNETVGNWSSLTYDGTHPNDIGYQVMAQTWFNTLSKPSVTTLEANSIRETTVILNGLVNPKGHKASYYFEYGPTKDYGATTTSMDAGSGNSEINVSVDLTGLNGETIYHFRLVATNSYGTSYGNDITFTTPNGIATTLEASSIGVITATLNGLVNPHGINAIYYFEYGTTNNYGSTTAVMDASSGEDEVAVSTDLKGLAGETTYHFRLVVTRSPDTSFGGDLTFTTYQGSGGGGGCFIATAAFGSSLEPHVIMLKKFRDKYLMVSGWGRKLVEFYYKTSPSIADGIADNGPLKILVRMCLYPLVGFSYVILNTSLEMRFFVVGFFILFAICFIASLRWVRLKNTM